ncbi:hypothetical protein BU26DRAFT_518584 [Trematosphaeria pertusa]|uniref:Uncharacterized protein n=1 Tax=Trematosphaeria pertusa TaxID=390896 RepID=A0A6A6IIA9_9PLEO|nr:uncharacterized protein BU26DRAFT_518584 [Trematosphaeria pertusa]KAF2250141.1 hypothetical protein BU26DRAFT_518584 [Trematosphaeria pertusa]
MAYIHRDRDYDNDWEQRYESYQSAPAERIHVFDTSRPRPSRDRTRGERRDTAFERRRHEVRLNEEQNTAVRWAYVVDTHRSMRGQAILDRIALIGPPQRRDPKTKLLESIIVPMRDIELDPLSEGQKPPSSRKLMYVDPALSAEDGCTSPHLIERYA